MAKQATHRILNDRRFVREEHRGARIIPGDATTYPEGLGQGYVDFLTVQGFIVPIISDDERERRERQAAEEAPVPSNADRVVADLRRLLTAAGVDFDSKARKADLVVLADEHGLGGE